MNLSFDQIKKLHYHINGKHIPYIEVRDEVLDHYQTALEKEKERSFEEVLAELDETFTDKYCRHIAGRYLQNLRAEYPSKFKEEFFSLFSIRKIWIPLLVLGLVLMLSIYVPKTGVLIHLLNSIIILSFTIENWLIAKYYPNNEKMHHYRLIDKKPIFAHTKAATPKGFAILHLVCFIMVFIPLLFIYLMEGGHENDSSTVFQPPYLYATVIGVWIFLLMMIVRSQAKINLSNSQLS
ncbi:hypothetical protein [Pararhodonellum marinum]|uniref:hypothetical protein n=1 Tax=Pararhodonellum marinum TaxID=2755358 RepID=UPI00188FEDFF|nr:hypothetical protein [Pararhodonellum marinum]